MVQVMIYLVNNLLSLRIDTLEWNPGGITKKAEDNTYEKELEENI